MEKILRGVIHYTKTHRLNLLKDFERVRDNPKPTAVFISCMDSRLFPPQFTSASVGDMFIMRNAGNLIPHAPNHLYDTITTEPGGLELGCIRNNIKDVIVCGHSDCKAMNLLHSLIPHIHDHSGTPLECWVKKHGAASVFKFKIYNRYPERPLQFVSESPDQIFDAYIDPENKFAPADKFSMINVLQQLQNIASYPFLHTSLQMKKVRLHAMWFDIYTGNVYLFCRKKGRFLMIDDDTLNELLVDSDAVLLKSENSECSHDHK